MPSSPKQLSPLGQAALKYAKDFGWAVFPLIPYNKRPIIKDIYNASSSDPKQIIEWWSDTPMANIALDCGKSHVNVIDADAKHDGPRILDGLKLVSGGRKAWDTRQHGTPGGGLHYLFEAPKDSEGVLPTRSGTFGGPGIDTRSKGGYIVLPPSTLQEYQYKAYTVLRDLPLLCVPRALLSRPGAAKTDEAGRTEIEAILESQQPIKAGERDTTLTRIGGKLRRIGFGELEIRSLLLSLNEIRCQPPMLEIDVYRIAKSAASWTPVEDLARDAAAVPLEGVWNDQDQAVAVSLATFLKEKKEDTKWVINNLFQASSLNMIMGSPKSGKSTLSRTLAVDVSLGKQTLGQFDTTRAPVLYYSLQENQAHLTKWFNSVLSNGKLDSEQIPLDLVFRLGRRGPHAIKGLRERLLARPYGLVVIDMLSRFISVRSLDDYAETESSLSDLKDIADETGACIIWLHHERKSGGEFEGGIGSQAIRGAVYTTLKCVKESGVYSISTEQRDGDDLEDTIIKLDKATGELKLTTQTRWLLSKGTQTKRKD